MPVIELLQSFFSASFENPFVIGFGVAVVRAFWGWLENAAKDKKITGFELYQLFETMFRVIPQAIGLQAFGIPAEGAFVTDYFYKAIKGQKKK